MKINCFERNLAIETLTGVQGVERAWHSEYNSEFSYQSLTVPSVSPDHKFYQTPNTVQTQMAFADHNRSEVR